MKEPRCNKCRFSRIRRDQTSLEVVLAGAEVRDNLRSCIKDIEEIIGTTRYPVVAVNLIKERIKEGFAA